MLGLGLSCLVAGFVIGFLGVLGVIDGSPTEEPWNIILPVLMGCGTALSVLGLLGV